MIAKRLQGQQRSSKNSNRYSKWIDNYTADDYNAAVEKGRGKFFSSLSCRRVARAGHGPRVKEERLVDQNVHQPGCRVRLNSLEKRFMADCSRLSSSRCFLLIALR